MVSDSYSASDTSGLCWSVLADRVRLKHPKCSTGGQELSHTAGGGGWSARELDRAVDLQWFSLRTSSYLHGQANKCHI